MSNHCLFSKNSPSRVERLRVVTAIGDWGARFGGGAGDFDPIVSDLV